MNGFVTFRKESFTCVWALVLLAAFVFPVRISGAPSVPQSSMGQPGLGAGDRGRLEDLFEKSVEAQLKELGPDKFEGLIGLLEPEAQRNLGDLDLGSIVRGDSQGGPDLSGFPSKLGRYALSQFSLNLGLLGQLLTLGVLASLLVHLAPESGGSGAKEVALVASLLALLYLTLQSFSRAAEVSKSAMADMVALMEALLPMMSAMLAAVGALTSAALFHPILMGVVTAVAVATKDLVIPLVYLGTALSIAGSFSPDLPLSRLAQLFRQIAMGVLGLLFTGFLGLIAIRGAVAPVADGIALRTARFAAGTFVPVVGGMMAEAVDVVAGGSLLIKNAVGATGLALIVLAAAFPLVKIFSLMMVYKVVTAVIEPIGDRRLVAALGGVGDGLMLLFGALLVGSLMFFVAITVLVGLGSFR